MSNNNQYLNLLRDCLSRLEKQIGTVKSAAVDISNAPKVMCVGIGKSGYLAAKISASLTSISLDSRYIHPSEALHGDIGCANKGDLAIIFSKSGNSSEINSLLPTLIKRGVELVCITNRTDSRLALASKWVIPIAVEHEGDEHNLLPLISTDLSLIVGNMIVSEVARLRCLQPLDFAQNHPEGQLGFVAGKTLSDIDNWKLRRPFVKVGTSLMQAIIEESSCKAGMVCVLDESGGLVGIITDGDIRRALVSGVNFQTSLVDDLLNKFPVTLRVSLPLADALAVMELQDKKLLSAPVLSDDGLCIGVVVVHDLIRVS